MCGIAACAGLDAERLIELTNGLRCDQSETPGVAVRLDNSLQLWRDETPPSVGRTASVAHTHGSTRPQTDCTGEVAVAHAGSLDNAAVLRDRLRADGHDLDGELVAHLIESRLAEGMTTEEAFRSAFDQLSGSYAVAAVFAGENAVYATREGESVVLGSLPDGMLVASDATTVARHTDRTLSLRDGEFLRATPTGCRLTDRMGVPLDRSPGPADTDHGRPVQPE